MRDKIVLITGATGGLGSAVTAAFLEAGARVGAVSRSAGTRDTDALMTIACDIANLGNAQSATNALIDRWGRIDALVHLMGGFAGGAPLQETTDETIEQMFDINFKSAVHMIRAVLPQMRARKSGRIVAVGSRAAVEPSANVAAYSASKAALVSLIRTVALENKARGITANVILPGTMDTPANRTAMPNADFTKWVPPAQVARLMVHLVSDEASAISGAAIPVYGGER